MKWIGQHIYDYIARFRSDVYLESLGTSSETNTLVVDSDGKITKNTGITGDITNVGVTAPITGGGSSGSVTIAISTATTSAVGAASFDSGDFAVDGGAVTVKSGGVDFGQIAGGAYQTSGESFVDNDTSLMTSAAIDDRINTVAASLITAEDLDVEADSGEPISVDLNSQSLTVTGGKNVTTSVTGQAVTVNVDSTLEGPIEIEQGVSGGASTLLIDNNDVDQQALEIDAANTTASIFKILAPDLTTDNAIFINADSLTSGAGIKIDSDDALTTSATKSLSIIDYDKAGVTASGQTSITTGLSVRMCDAATNHASGAVTMTGARLDVDSANAQGTITQKGLVLNVAADGVGDAATTSGIEMEVMDGGTDIKMMSHADTADYCTVGVTTNGATTITTVDDGAAAAHFEVAADGDITLDAASRILIEPGSGSAILLDGTVTVDGGSVTGITTLGVDSVSLTAVQTSAESFADDDTSIMTSAAIDDRKVVGQLAVLRCSAFYVNDNPMVQNNLYFGSSTGNQPMNWNDPAAVGGVIGDTSSFAIAGDDENWGILLPFNISKVDVQCSMRPQLGTGDDFTIAIYTGIRSDDSSADLTLTKVAHNSVALSSTGNRYTRNDVSVTADYNAGTMIYVGVGSEDSTDMKNGRGYMNITVTRR